MSSAPTHGDADLTRSGLTPLDPDDILSPAPGRGSGRRPAHTQVAGTGCGQLQPTCERGAVAVLPDTPRNPNSMVFRAP